MPISVAGFNEVDISVKLWRNRPLKNRCPDSAQDTAVERTFGDTGFKVFRVGPEILKGGKCGLPIPFLCDSLRRNTKSTFDVSGTQSSSDNALHDKT